MTQNSYLCNFIKENPFDWQEKLSKNPYFLKIKEMNGLYIFNYDLLAFEVEGFDTMANENIVKRTDFALPIVQEARGIIIDAEKCEVVCWPFRKFGNYGESYADDIDWNSARVQAKVDGSIIKLFFDKRPEFNKWTVATNSVIDAHSAGSNFGDIFDNAAKDVLNYDLLNKDCTYIFELVSPQTQVVVKYPEEKIYHIGTRSNITGEEFIVDIGVEKPKEYNLISLDECIEAAESLNKKNEESSRFDVEFEGFVVVDKNFHRIKIKSPEYLLAHHSLNNGILSLDRMIELLEKNELEEYLSYFPNYKEKFDKLTNRYYNLINDVDAYIVHARDLFKTVDNQKEFALKVSGDLFKSFAFQAVKFPEKDGKTLISEMSSKAKRNLLEKEICFEEKNPSFENKEREVKEI